MKFMLRSRLRPAISAEFLSRNAVRISVEIKWPLILTAPYNCEYSDVTSATTSIRRFVFRGRHDISRATKISQKSTTIFRENSRENIREVLESQPHYPVYIC
jgi:hypothetical protein